MQNQLKLKIIGAMLPDVDFCYSAFRKAVCGKQPFGAGMKSRFSPISLSSDALAHACGAQGCAWTNVFSGVKLWAICGAIRKGNCQLLAEGSNPITLALRPSVFDAPPLKIAVDNDAANPSLEIDCDGGMPNRPESLYRQGFYKTPFHYPYFYPYSKDPFFRFLERSHS